MLSGLDAKHHILPSEDSGHGIYYKNLVSGARWCLTRLTSTRQGLSKEDDFGLDVVVLRCKHLAGPA